MTTRHVYWEAAAVMAMTAHVTTGLQETCWLPCKILASHAFGLEFGRYQMNVEAVLRNKGRVVTVAHDTDGVSSVVHLLAAKRIGAVVVKDVHGKMVGVFSERDLVNALARYDSAALSREVGELMSSPVVTCKASDRIEAAMALMTQHRIRHLPVLADGELTGIISIGDLVQYRLVEKENEANVLLDIARMRA